jgi:hypothetical protein
MTERDGLCTQVSSATVLPGQRVPQDGILSGGIGMPITVNPAAGEAAQLSSGAAQDHSA